MKLRTIIGAMLANVVRVERTKQRASTWMDGKVTSWDPAKTSVYVLRDRFLVGFERVTERPLFGAAVRLGAGKRLYVESTGDKIEVGVRQWVDGLSETGFVRLTTHKRWGDDPETTVASVGRLELQVQSVGAVRAWRERRREEWERRTAASSAESAQS